MSRAKNRYYDGVENGRPVEEVNLLEQAAFIVSGFQTGWTGNVPDQYGVGFDGAVRGIMESGFPHRCLDLYNALWIATQEDFSGVFVYEVTEQFGKWLVDHMEATNEEADMALVGLCANFLNNSDIGNLKAQTIAALVMKELQDGNDAEAAGRRVLHRILEGNWPSESERVGVGAAFDSNRSVDGSEGARTDEQDSEGAEGRTCIACGNEEGNETCVTCGATHTAT